MTVNDTGSRPVLSGKTRRLGDTVFRLTTMLAALLVLAIVVGVR